MIVPVFAAHVGWVIVASGVAGAPGTALITKPADEVQVGLAVIRTLIVWVVFAVNPLNVVEVCQFVPSLLYSNPAPKGEVTRIAPMVSAQVGCVIVPSGTEGGTGAALITKFAVEIHVGWEVVRALIV